MLAYYVGRHMRRAWAPLPFGDNDPQAAAQHRGSPVKRAVRSPNAKDKTSSKKTSESNPVHRF